MAISSPTYERINLDLREAMRHRRAQELSCLRQVKGRIQEAEARLETPSLTEADVLAAISGYRKQLEKAMKQMAAAGPKGEATIAQYRAECALLMRYLPPPLAGAALEAAIAEVAQAAGIDDPKGAGRLLGKLVEAHGDRVDPKSARPAVELYLRGAG